MPHKNKRKQWDLDDKTSVEVPTSISQARLRALAGPGRALWDNDASTVEQPLDMPLPEEAYREDEQGVPFDGGADRAVRGSGARVMLQSLPAAPTTPASPKNDMCVGSPVGQATWPRWIVLVVALGLLLGGAWIGRQLANLEAVRVFVRSLGLLD